MRGYLLDANVLIDGLRGHVAVRLRLDEARGELCYLSTIVYHELWYGVQKSIMQSKNADRLRRVMEGIKLLDFAPEDAEAAGQIRAALERRKQPIGHYDTLVAGQALARGLTLVTANEGEFRRVEGLHVENWRTLRL